MNLKKDYLLESLGPQDLVHKDKKHRCTRFQLTGTGTRPISFWVDEAGALRQLVIDDRQFLVLEDK
jgi:hypothetical protein